MSEIPTFKCFLVGDKGTGKTTFVTRHLSGSFEKVYEATTSFRVHPLLFHTNHGPIQFIVWEIVNKKQLTEGQYGKADCAIIMYDVRAKRTYRTVRKWNEDLTFLCNNKIQIVVAGNKAHRDRLRNCTNFFYHGTNNYLQYYKISVKSKYNITKPFLWLARRLMVDPILYFVDAPPPAPGPGLQPQIEPKPKEPESGEQSVRKP